MTPPTIRPAHVCWTTLLTVVALVAFLPILASRHTVLADDAAWSAPAPCQVHGVDTIERGRAYRAVWLLGDAGGRYGFLEADAATPIEALRLIDQRPDLQVGSTLQCRRHPAVLDDGGQPRLVATEQRDPITFETAADTGLIVFGAIFITAAFVAWACVVVFYVLQKRTPKRS